MTARVGFSILNVTHASSALSQLPNHRCSLVLLKLSPCGCLRSLISVVLCQNVDVFTLDRIQKAPLGVCAPCIGVQTFSECAVRIGEENDATIRRAILQCKGKLNDIFCHFLLSMMLVFLSGSESVIDQAHLVIFLPPSGCVTELPKKTGIKLICFINKWATIKCKRQGKINKFFAERAIHDESCDKWH